MEINKISFRVERTVNTGNYENVKYTLEQTADLEEPLVRGSKEHKKAVKSLAANTINLIEEVVAHYHGEVEDE